MLLGYLHSFPFFDLVEKNLFRVAKMASLVCERENCVGVLETVVSHTKGPRGMVC